MNEFNVVALRFAFLVLLWLFVFAIVVALRRDIGISQAPSLAINRKTAANGSPETTQQRNDKLPARLLEVVAGAQRGERIPLSGSPIVLGRAQDSDFVLKDDYASGRHARLFPQGSRWFIEDLGSTNGVSVAGQALARTTPIDVNVPIQIGKTVLELKA